MTNPVASLAALLQDFEDAVRLHESSEPNTHEWGQAGKAVEYQRAKIFAEARGVQYAPREPDSRSPYDGMVDFTPETALRWALDYIADGSDETPPHVCEFVTNPPKGACDFHERYWAAREALEWARGRPEGPSAPSREAIYAVLRARGQQAIDSYQHSALIEDVRRDLTAAYAVDFGTPDPQEPK